LWQQTAKGLEAMVQATPTDDGLKMELAHVYYGLLGTSIALQDEDLFDAYRDKAINLMSSLEKVADFKASAKALRAGVYGIEMGFSPWKGMSLGMKSGSLIDAALEADEAEPLAWKERAGSKLHTPAMFGGSKAKAVTFYAKAVSLYEDGSHEMAWNWQYLQTLTWYGIALQEHEAYDEALAVYARVLAMAPDYGWVKFVLQPKAAKQESAF